MTVPFPHPTEDVADAPVPFDWLHQPTAISTSRGDYASVIRRIAAFLVDSVLLIGAAIVAGIFFGERAVELVTQDGESYLVQTGTLTACQARVVLLCWFLYLAAAEAVFGATLGKRVLGIVVMQNNWTRLSIRGAVLRHLTHVVPTIVFAQAGLSLSLGQAAVFVVGTIFIKTSEDRQRLGDRLAGTIVVRKSSLKEQAP
jgi:uncharacterized RDD family membrane protein YckC